MKHLLLLLTALTPSVTFLHATDNHPDTPIGITLNKSFSIVKCGNTDTLSATFLPQTTTDPLNWTSDDPTIATVQQGIIKTHSNGTTTITATTTNGHKASCTIHVNQDGTDYRSQGPRGMPPGNPGQGNMPPGRQPGEQEFQPNRPNNRPERPNERAEKTDENPDRPLPPNNMMPPQRDNTPFGQGPRPQRPDGMPPQDGNPGRPGPQETDQSTAYDPGAYRQTEGDTTIINATYTSQTADANTVKLTGGKLTLTNPTLTKTAGDATNPDGSSFYGTNAAILATNNSYAHITGGTITTNAIGANAIVAYGGKIDVADMTINCQNRLSRGIHATGGGTINATNLDIATQGPNSSVIALDRGGGTVTATQGNYTAAGRDCAIMYSTGNLTANNITGTSQQGEIAVIEGDNFIAINNSHLTSHADATSRGMMILQSGSGDAGQGLNGIITVAGGSLTMTQPQTPLIEIVTNVTGKVTLNGVKLTIPSGILMKVDYNQRWQTYGATGILVLSGNGTTYQGDIIADRYSNAQLTITEGTQWIGALNKDNTAHNTTIQLRGGTWTLTDNSNVDNITLTQGAQIIKNGHTLNYKHIDNTSGTITD